MTALRICTHDHHLQLTRGGSAYRHGFTIDVESGTVASLHNRVPIMSACQHVRTHSSCGALGMTRARGWHRKQYIHLPTFLLLK
jgi:hypothetical protein